MRERGAWELRVRRQRHALAQREEGVLLHSPLAEGQKGVPIIMRTGESLSGGLLPSRFPVAFSLGKALYSWGGFFFFAGFSVFWYEVTAHLAARLRSENGGL